MKIEELYPKIEMESVEKEVGSLKPARSIAHHVSASSEEKKSKLSSGNKTKRSLSPKRKRQQSAPNRHSSSGKMKLEQVNRHEEHSYLLEAETNRAILENIVCKDELCRYLSPLKFIEIDSWRRDVPYGLKLDCNGDRRKWRSPMEILYAGGAFKEAEIEKKDCSISKKLKNQVASSGANSKLRRRHLLRNKGKKDSNEKQTYLEKTDVTNGEANDVGRDAPSSAYKMRDIEQRRPATSPNRKVLSKVKSERILSQNQTATSALIDVRNNSFESQEVLGLSNGLHHRLSLSSVASLRRTTSISPSKFLTLSQENPEKSLEKANLRTKKIEFEYYRQLSAERNDARNFQTANESLSKTHFPSIRPRTRGQANYGRTAVRSQTAKSQEFLGKKDALPINSQDSIEREFSGKLSEFHLDPNIAYIPQSYRFEDGLGESDPCLNQAIAAPDKTKSCQQSGFESDKLAAAVGVKQNSKPMTAVKETIHSLRDSSFLSAPSPRVENITPRAIHSDNLRINSSWTSKLTSSAFQSPWVAQALPDFSKSDVAARAEREGYYVRKHNKTVSFRVSDSDLEKRKWCQNPDMKKNVSMVVVNVDEPSKTALSHRDAAKLARNSNSFTNNNVISVRQ